MGNQEYADQHQTFVNETSAQFTMREMRRICASPKFWIVLAAAIAVLTVSGPFGTSHTLKLSDRLVYWAFIALTTFVLGFCTTTFFGRMLFRWIKYDVIAFMAGGVAAGPVVGMFVWVVNGQVFDEQFSTYQNFATFMAYATVIAVSVALMFSLFAPKATDTSDSATKSAGTGDEPVAPNLGQGEASRQDGPSVQVAFINRLPKHLGQDLISLEAQDHYVQATTTQGNAMVLIRFGDAMAEMEGMAGLQVHRSWWVATRHVKALERKQSKLILTLSNDVRVPVSRSFAKAVTGALEMRK